MKKYRFYYLVVILVILIDQTTKLLVHYYMEFGHAGEIPIFGKWLRIHYTLNPGMAFGIRIPNKYFKLFLTSFRIFATYLIASHLPRLIKNLEISRLLVFAWTLILGGAIGNIIDSVFYGILLNNTPPGAPMNIFYGQVIDMILVGIENIWIPSFIPFIGGNYLPPFPVFNIADSSICIGVSFIILDAIIKKIQHKFYGNNANETLKNIKEPESKVLQ